MRLQKCIIFPLTGVGRSVGVSGNTLEKSGPMRLLKLIRSNYFFQQFICNEEDKKKYSL